MPPAGTTGNRTLKFNRPRLRDPVAATEAADMQGHVFLGRYRVTRPLDMGGMCKLYLASHIDLRREVVVKVLQDHLLQQPKAVEHFRREIYILSRFQHPYAVAYCDSSPNEPGGPVLVMEYLRGLDLGQLLQRDGRFAPERVGRLLIQLCDVLQAAHDAGILHRDIKPGNLMILHPGTPQEVLKLMDFGLARMSSLLYIAPGEVADFSLPAAAGTPEYIAPEQARGQDMDHRGDIYSVGVVLYELLTGRRPFAYASPQQLLDAHAGEEPPTFAEQGARHVPAPVEAVVRSCLVKHPDQRPQSAQELATRFEQAIGRKIATPGSRGSGIRRVVVPPAAGQSSSTAIPVVRPTLERHTTKHSFEVNLPEAMALLKVKGFIQDLGGEVTESVPGMIRVLLREPRPAPVKRSGLFSLRGNSREALLAQPPRADIDLELHLERKEPAQPNRLTITLVMRPTNGNVPGDWRERCAQIGGNLKAYL
jgi:serine/threonine-protein kinase